MKRGFIEGDLLARQARLVAEILVDINANQAKQYTD